jgi:hypothetical protein
VAVSAHKKVLVSRFGREPVEGFIQPPESQQEVLEVLRADGSLLKVPISETKAICFVRDFDGGEIWKKHRQFSARPKMGGLWIRLRFRDGDSLEGIVPNNLMHLEQAGFGVVPPDPTFQNQRIWVPRPALEGVEVLGVIGSPLRRRKPGEKPDETQLRMFE